MEDENEYMKLPTEEKCVHKIWKARIQGYEEAVKLFNQIGDEKSAEWKTYLELIKKFVTDSNAIAQEKGMEAALVFVEKCGHAGKTVGEVMSGIVAKCIAAPKAKTKDLALQITLMYVEIEKQDIVEAELLKGMEQKNPKVVAASVAALNSALKQFGNKVIAIKPMVKKIPVLLTDRHQTIRNEMKALVIEMHRWMGRAIEPHIESLQAVMQHELREAFSSSGTAQAQPTRYLRSQQHRVREVVADAPDGGSDDEDAETGGGDSGDMRPYDLDPVDILSRLPKDFYEKLEAKNWQERKEALEGLEILIKTAPVLEPGEYADLVRALKKVISKDANVVLVTLSGRLLGAVAAGLRNGFAPYAAASLRAILDKFKEKKAAVLTALREAADAIYPSCNLEVIMEDLLEAFDHKNPSVKAESAQFLARALSVTPPGALNKRLIKAYVAGLLKLLDSADVGVRDAAAEALGAATKLVGEQHIAPHLGKIDPLKEHKIKQFADKAEIIVKIAAPKKTAPAPSAKGDYLGDYKPAQSEPAAKRAGTGLVKKAAAGGKKPAGRTAPGGSAPGGAAPGRAAPQAPRERYISQGEVDATAEQLFAADVIDGLVDGNWRTRLQSAQSFYSTVQSLSSSDASSQVLYRVLNKKPGLKDINVQVLKVRLEACKHIAVNFPVSTTAADFILQDVVSKLGEASCSAACAACLSALAAACGAGHVLAEGLRCAVDGQVNPRVQSQMFHWMISALKEFGLTMSPKAILSHTKKALSATNHNVRMSAVNFIGVLSLYVEFSLIDYFDSEKLATKQLISLELDKYANSRPPTPTRQLETVSKSASEGSVSDEFEEGDDERERQPAEAEVAVVDDARPKTDITLLTDALLAEINDKNWRPGSKTVILAALDEARPSLPVQPLPPAKEKKEDSAGVKTAGAKMKECEKKVVSAGKKAPPKPSSVSSRGKKDNEDTSTLLPINNAKKQRIIDDQMLKVLRWNFKTPRQEFFLLLKQQMTNVGVNKQLIANMFHNDFRYHLQAIEELSQDLQDNGPALMANLDLVLKWITLRFFDTNPSVILKSLEYLSNVFQYLKDSDYTMTEYEAYCFLPYLILKVGDLKDGVRNAVKSLLRQICAVYSVTKLFGYLISGLKSKIARQRTECLEFIGHLIEVYGSAGMSPNEAAILKELARHIGDKDFSVRSAALNCVVNAYFIEGEKMFQMIGQIAENHLSVLQQRIERAGNSRGAEAPRFMVVPPSATGRPMRPVMNVTRTIAVHYSPVPEEDEHEETPPITNVTFLPPQPQVVASPFGLDPRLISELDAMVPVVSRLALPELDLKFLDESIRLPTRPHLPRRPILNTHTHRTETVKNIHAFGNPDLNAAIRALSHIQEALLSGREAPLAAYEELLVTAMASQLRHLRTGTTSADPQEILPAYWFLTGVLNSFYETGCCGNHMGETALSSLLGELLRGLGGGALSASGGGAVAGTLEHRLSHVCACVLVHAQRDTMLCAIVSLLHDSIGVTEPSCPRYQELLIKACSFMIKMAHKWDANSIDYGAVLNKIHLFYKAYPKSYWNKNPEICDTPCRTVVYILCTLVELKGASIINYISHIPDADESDLHTHLLKVIKQLNEKKKENTSDAMTSGQVLASVAPSDAAINQNGSPRVHEDALSQLYDLRERHPEVEVRAETGAGAARPHDDTHISNENDEQPHVAFLERLRALQAKAGLKPESSAGSRPRAPRAPRAPLAPLAPLAPRAGCSNENIPHGINPPLQLHTTQTLPRKNEAEIEALCLKLQQIKSSFKK